MEIEISEELLKRNGTETISLGKKIYKITKISKKITKVTPFARYKTITIQEIKNEQLTLF